VNKEVKDMAVGIGIRATNDIPFISSIHAGSLLETSALRIGMGIQSINNQSMSGKTAREAAGLIRDAVGEITIVAGWNLSVSSPFITAPIACPDEEDKNPLSS
jgi:C-terminal processing protease CtpA/Prc